MSDHLFELRKQRLLETIEAMEDFLSRQKSEVAASPFANGGISHFNVRLFMQAHAADLIEASNSYDQAVTIRLANEHHKQERNQTT